MIFPAIIIIFITIITIIRSSRKLDILQLGEPEAYRLGIDIKRLRFNIIISSAIIVGISVSLTGMIGFVGLLHRTKEEFDTRFMPSTEIGWRLSAKHWNQGYATEAALAVLDYAFKQLNLTEVVSITVPQNKASRRIMEKIGLHYSSNEDFDHPKLPKNSPLRRHVLYRLTRKEYINKR